MYMKSWSFVTTARFSTSEAFAWIVSGARFVASVKSNPRLDSKALSSLRTFSSSKNRIGIDDDIVLLGDGARVVERSRNLRAREARHESVLDGFDRFSGSEQLEYLPDHDAGTFEGRLAMADLRVGDNIFVENDTLVHSQASISQ